MTKDSSNIHQDIYKEVSAGLKQLPLEDRRHIIIHVLATAVVDILLDEKERVRSTYEESTC